MDDGLLRQRDASLARLEALIRRGRRIRSTPNAEGARVWQQDCAAAINQLSGGSKSHWLARAYGGAFLVSAAGGGVILEVDAAEIVDRILGVLGLGVSSLSRMDDAADSSAAPPPRRFEFVRAAELRPVLERTYAECHDALERGEFARSLVLSCSILEALLTDALESARPRAHDVPEARFIERSFESRIAAAESEGLIRSGCARLPPVARRYRDLTDAEGELRSHAPVSEREARITAQVLRVVMRDLDPGR